MPAIVSSVSNDSVLPPGSSTATCDSCDCGTALPALAKAAGNYLSSQLISMEAKRLGFAEGIGLGVDGTVSEGAGENLFVIRDGVIYTPAIAHCDPARHHARHAS